MILDNLALLSDKQAIVASAASTDFYDFLAPGQVYDGAQLQRRLGIISKIPFSILVNEDFDNLTSLTIALQSDEDNAFGSPTTILSVSVPLADLVAGYVFPIDRLPRKLTERYFRVNYTVVGANPTQGQITAGFFEVDGMQKSGF